MFERFTQTSRRAIFFCRQEAMQRGASEISTVDLFLGLLHEPTESEPAIASLHSRATEFRQLLTVATSNTGEDPNLPLSAESKRSLALAAQEADRQRSNEITRHHLLQGILQSGDSTAAKLRSVGVTI